MKSARQVGVMFVIWLVNAYPYTHVVDSTEAGSDHMHGQTLVF